MGESQPPFVSVKFDAVGRTHRSLLPEIDFEPPLRVGEPVVVTRGESLAYGTVAQSALALEPKIPWQFSDTSAPLLRFLTRCPRSAGAVTSVDSRSGNPRCTPGAGWRADEDVKRSPQ